ncbi:MAG: peptidylprolyl isomerase [bacterium]
MGLRENMVSPVTQLKNQLFKFLKLNKTVPFIIPFIVMGMLMGCGSGGEKNKAASIICAKVNGKKISLEDFDQELQRLNLDSEMPYIESEDQLKTLRKELLLLMIDKEVLVQEAKKKGITIGPEDIEVSLRDISKGYPEGKFSVEEYLNDPAHEKWRYFFLQGLLTKKLIEQEIEPSIHVTEDEARSFFLSHRQDFERDREFRARQIVVESEMEAREILKLLKEGHDFVELAKERSLSPDREDGGDLGFFGLGQMPPEFDEVIVQLKKGEISDVVQSDYGYHIFQLMEIHEPKEAQWEEARPKIEQILLAKKRDRAFHDWLFDLRSHSHIKVNSKALAGGN